jgi:hypothetical protein
VTTRWRCLFLSAHSTGVLSDVDLMVPTISLSVDSREDPAARCGFRRPGRGAGGWGSSIAHVAWGRWVKARASSRAGRAVHPLGKTYLLELGRVYAAAWNEGGKALESGQPVAAALKSVGQSWACRSRPGREPFSRAKVSQLSGCGKRMGQRNADARVMAEVERVVVQE